MIASTDGIDQVFQALDRGRGHGGRADRDRDHSERDNKAGDHLGSLRMGPAFTDARALARMKVDAVAEAEAARERARSLIASARSGEQRAAGAASAPIAGGPIAGGPLAGARLAGARLAGAPGRPRPAFRRVRRLPLLLFLLLVAGSLLLLASHTVAAIGGLIDGRTGGGTDGVVPQKAPAAAGTDRPRIR